ncbi:Cysteine-rich protein 2 [Balamuthia mandrillaris]
MSSKKCPMCDKPVYFAERKSAGGYDYHPLCLKCRMCGKQLQLGGFAENKGIVYCKPCYGSGYKFASTQTMTGSGTPENSWTGRSNDSDAPFTTVSFVPHGRSAAVQQQQQQESAAASAGGIPSNAAFDQPRKFDPMTGEPLPKFDPMTGKQNWW